MSETTKIYHHNSDELDSVYSLVVPVAEGSVLLGRKTRGFGMGKRVFPGGKDLHSLYALSGGILPGPHNAARELYEETGLTPPLNNFHRLGTIHVLDGHDERDITIFEAEITSPDQAAASDELNNLAWIPKTSLPYDDMPKDYKIWLPWVIGGYTVDGHIEIDDCNQLYGTVFGMKRDLSGSGYKISTGQG